MTDGYLGIDFGGMSDATAWVRAVPDGRRGEGGHLHVVDAAELPRSNASDLPFDAWQEAELLAEIRDFRDQVDGMVHVIVDRSGAGRTLAVNLAQAFQADRRVTVARLNIHGGEKATFAGDAWSVAKADLMTAAKDATERTIDGAPAWVQFAAFPVRDRLIRQLDNIEMVALPSGGYRYEARGQAADDLAVALAYVVYAEQMHRSRQMRVHSPVRAVPRPGALVSPGLRIPVGTSPADRVGLVVRAYRDGGLPRLSSDVLRPGSGRSRPGVAVRDADGPRGAADLPPLMPRVEVSRSVRPGLGEVRASWQPSTVDRYKRKF